MAAWLHVTLRQRPLALCGQLVQRARRCLATSAAPDVTSAFERVITPEVAEHLGAQVHRDGLYVPEP